MKAKGLIIAAIVITAAPYRASAQPLERFRFRRNHTEENALRCTSSTGSVKVGIALLSGAGVRRSRHAAFTAIRCARAMVTSSKPAACASCA
jgi:hypothetical protein